MFSENLSKNNEPVSLFDTRINCCSGLHWKEISTKTVCILHNYPAIWNIRLVNFKLSETGFARIQGHSSVWWFSGYSSLRN